MRCEVLYKDKICYGKIGKELGHDPCKESPAAPLLILCPVFACGSDQHCLHGTYVGSIAILALKGKPG